MLSRVTAVLLFSLTLITTGCGASTMKTPDTKQNANAKQRYEITMTIDGAPGPFDSIDGYVTYQVENDDCVPLQPGSGARLAPDKSVPVTFTREAGADNVFRGTFYTDLLQDENYFGLGVCHWTVGGTGAKLNVGKTVFSTGMSLDEVRSEKPFVTYFANSLFHNPRIEGGDTGTVRTAYVAQHPNEFFSVTLVTKKDF